MSHHDCPGQLSYWAGRTQLDWSRQGRQLASPPSDAIEEASTSRMGVQWSLRPNSDNIEANKLVELLQEMF
jgi:hypothetical protein